MRSMWTLLLTLTGLTTTTHAFTTAPPAVMGRYVVFAGDTSQVCFNVGEIEVYNTNHVNVAQLGAAWQSDYWDATTLPASHLNDGNVSTIARTSCGSGVPMFGNLTFPGNITPVATVSYAWMAIDLGEDMSISSVVIHNTHDPCCTFPLREDVRLRIFDSQAMLTFGSGPFINENTQTLIPTPIITSAPYQPTQPPTPVYPVAPTSSPTTTTAPYYPTQPPTPSYPWSPTTAPTSQDRGTFWPWSTPSGILPSVKSASFINPQADSMHHIIWQLDAVLNGTSEPAGWVSLPNGLFHDIGTTSQHTYYHVTFYNYNDAAYFWNYDMLPSSARAWVQYGKTIREANTMTNGAALMLRYSYLWNDYRIPSLSSSTTEWKYSTYYVTARSRDGEFRMITYPTYSQAQQAYLAAVMENALPSGDKQWTTVKFYSNGYIQSQYSTCRGSELEHLGAFQWLELPQRYNRYYSSYYYMLVSWRSLSGVRLERMQSYSDYPSATTAQAWVTWYSSTYDPYHFRATSVIVYNQYSYFYGNYDYTYLQQLQQDYYWITGSSATPTTYPYPTPNPNPYYQPTSTRWADLTKSQQTFIIAYPTALIAAAVMSLLITGCCLKRRTSTTTATPTDISPCYRRISCVVVLLCLASLTLLITSISLKNFNTVQVKYSSTVWAMYGPFHMFQTTPYLSWLPVYWNAKVMGMVAGVAMIISMVASTATIGIIKNSWGTTSRTSFLSILALISSLLAALVWIPVHVRVFDRNIEYAVLQGSYPNGGNYYPYNYDYNYNYSYYYGTVQQLVGTSYILLCATIVVQLVNVIIMSCIHKKCCSRTQRQAENDGLQLVQPTSPYYYRDVPAAVPVPAVPAPYIYGVPASSAPPPFAFTHYQPQPSGYAYAAPMYYPSPAAPVAEPLHQPIVAPAAYPAQAAAPAPVPVPVPDPAPAPGPSSAGYPTLPAEVPLSGPSTAYQRLL